MIEPEMAFADLSDDMDCAEVITCHMQQISNVYHSTRVSKQECQSKGVKVNTSSPRLVLAVPESMLYQHPFAA